MTIAVAALPQVLLELDGRPADPRLGPALERLEVSQELSTPAQCELTFIDLPEGFGGDGAPVLGAGLAVTIAGRSPALFVGDVTAIELGWQADAGRVLRVRAHDRLHRLRARQTIRALVDVTVADVATLLAGDLGVSVVADEPGPRWSRLVQDRQSDLRLLLETAERCGLHVALRETELHLMSLAGTGEIVPLCLGEGLLEATLELDAEPGVGGIAVTGWDAATMEPVVGEATTPRGGVPATPVVSDAGTRRELIDHGAPTADRAAAAAQAELDRRHAAGAVLRGVATGDPALRPGVGVLLDGPDPDLAGLHILTRVRHELDASRGYRVELSSEPPARRAQGSDASLRATLGKVRSVADPESHGRVQVSLSALRDIESSWMPVLSPGAGSGKGLVALPDVDDLVLVLLLGGDPAQGVVLGGLYGAGGPQDSGVVSDAVRRFILGTPGGQVLTLDDEQGTLTLVDASGGTVELADRRVRVEDATGNRLELTDQVVRLHAAVGLELDAPGQAIRIRGASVDFETA